MNITFPVMLPEVAELRMTKEDLREHITRSLRSKAAKEENNGEDLSKSMETANQPATVKASAFMDGLLADKAAVPTLDSRDGKMLTENSDVAFRTSGEPLVDLFFELEEVVSGDRLQHLLERAWKDDSDATLKIIWNARSIHIGKSSRNVFYRAVGWLAENHPVTLLSNLPWLVRPLIPKKALNKGEKMGKGHNSEADENPVEIEAEDSDFEMLEAVTPEDDRTYELDGKPDLKKATLDEDSALSEFDVKFGVAHGYWKDLLNILALAANDQLKVNGFPRSVLNVNKPADTPQKRDWTPGRKKAEISERHERVIKKLEEPFYRALHVSVSCLFSEQLKLDISRLRSGNRAEMKKITLAAKWAPSHKGMHDQHTCIVSSIAELLYAFDNPSPAIDSGDREMYLKHARLAYQTKILSPLRKYLSVVERPISANNFGEIKYERVPSLAMKQYSPLFAKKDYEHFERYIEMVASGKARISGATLLPSTLVQMAFHGNQYAYSATGTGAKNRLVRNELQEMKLKVLDGQWDTLVNRMKESGTLENSIAVCDVSGSMLCPSFADRTCPMHSAIGLSLLIAEITDPPFGGAIITFSEFPRVMRVGGADDERSFTDKVRYIVRECPSSTSTNFEAVFSELILPMAVRNKLKPEDMVKQIFVFTDMHFDSAHSADWRTSYQRIKQKFRDAGYPVPQLIFWNLAGGWAGFTEVGKVGRKIAPKPVTAERKGTALVSGYSQGQMKMFLKNGQFEAPEGEVMADNVKTKLDPISIVKLAISHEAYRMLKVVD